MKTKKEKFHSYQFVFNSLPLDSLQDLSKHKVWNFFFIAHLWPGMA